MRKLHLLACFLQLLSPILIYYDLPGTGLSVTTVINVICVILFAIQLANEKGKVVIPHYIRSFSFFSLWMISVTLLSSLFRKYDVQVGMALLNVVFVIIIIVAVCRQQEFKNTILNFYYSITFLVIVVFFIQQILQLFSGRLFPVVVPWLSIQSAYTRWFNSGSTSFFSENAHFAQYICPCICLKLFDYNEKKRIKDLVFAIVVTIVCLMSLSGNGIVVCVIIWLLYFGYSMRRNPITFFKYLISGIIVFAVVCTFLSRNERFMQVINHLFVDVSGNSYRMSKADYRIYRGFDYFSKLRNFDKLIGIGYKSLSEYTRYYGISSVYDATHTQFEYLNSICQILIYSGMVGLITFLSYLIRLFKCCSIHGKAVLIVFVSLSISSSILFDSSMIQYIILISCFIGSNLNYMEKDDK